MIASIHNPRKLWIAADAAERDLRAAELAVEERLIVADLRAVGIHLNSVWDLVNWRGEPYPEAVPVLLHHLPLFYSDRLAEGIARALSRPFARSLAWEPVLKLYKESPDFERAWFKDWLAVALSGMACQKDLDEIIKLVDDRQDGRTRIFSSITYLVPEDRMRLKPSHGMLMTHSSSRKFAKFCSAN